MLLNLVSDWFTPLIVALGVLHFFAFWTLRIWAGREVRNLAQLLERLTEGVHSRSRLDWQGHLTDQVDAFIEDIREAIRHPEQREAIAQRMRILDEQRRYLNSFRFETSWNVARTGIEIYPLLGVLGTIFALWLAMQSTAADTSSAVATIVERFALAIDSTFAGLTMAILLMVVHSFFEPLFVRLSENRRNVRELVAHAKQELIDCDPHGSETIG